MTVLAVMPPRRLPMIVAATSLGFGTVRVDGSIVNVALAQIGDSLLTSSAGLQWVVDAYTLALASLLLSGGALGDRIGARRVFACGFALFTAASLGCLLAPSVAVLIMARAAQGVGAALLLPCSLALLNHACGDDEGARAQAIGLWAAAGGVGVTAGPVLGGLLVSTLGWQSIFLINLPIGLIGIWLALTFAEETTPTQRGFDLAGQTLAIVGLTFLTAALIEAGPLGWQAPLVDGALFVASAAAIGFIVVEARSAAPMLPLSLFRNANFSAATVIGFIVSLTIFGLVFLLGLYFQQVLAYSPAQTGLAFVPFGVMTMIANVAAGWFGARAGARPVLIFGLLTAAAGYVLLRDIDATTSYASMLPGQLIIRLGIALSVPAMTAVMLSSVDRSRSGMASGVLNAFREAGSAVGVALFGTLTIDGAVGGLHTAIVLSAILLGAAAMVAMATVRTR